MTKTELANRIEDLYKGSTQGPWKLWGMDVYADLKGFSSVQDAVLVAKTYQLVDGHPRTFNASLICELQRNLPMILEALRYDPIIPCDDPGGP
jgi:hypothetical protein